MTRSNHIKDGRPQRSAKFKDIFTSLFSIPAICKDNPECSRYSVESCENDWMKVNCKKKCGLCEGKS